MLSVYEYTNQIKVISGSNFQNKKINSKNYYFSKYAHCWGWATWRRSWKEFDNKMSFGNLLVDQRNGINYILVLLKKNIGGESSIYPI